MPKTRPLTRKLDELRAGLASLPPELLAQRTGAGFTATSPGEGVFRLPLWGQEASIGYPDLVVYISAGDPPAPMEAREDVQALILYHFLTADGTPLAGEWIGFAELPSAAFYQQAYQGYTGASLAQAFGEDADAFAAAALALGGRAANFADRAFAFTVLPHFALLAAFWQGDEDFPSSYKILLDAAASRQLPTDVCAIVGGMLAGRLIKARAARA